MTDTSESNPHAASIRLQANTAHGHAGQRRHDLRIGGQPGYVDKGRLALNRVLIDPPSAAFMRDLASARRAKRHTQRGMKSNAGISTSGIITFGSEAALVFETLTQKQQDRAFRLLSRAIAIRLRTSLHGLVVHRDEATIHAHFVLCGYDRDGMPLSTSTSPSIMSGLQDLTAKVMQRSCPSIERGTRYGDRLAAGADYAQTVHRTVRELHRDLPRDLERRRQEVTKLAQAEADAAARVTEMRERVQKLTAKAELTDKENNRLGTYQNRLRDRLTELENARKAAEAGRIEADRLADLAMQDKFAADDAANKLKADAAAEVAQMRTKAATEARAHAAAFTALANEIEAESIFYDEDGNMVSANESILLSGAPYIDPAIFAALRASDVITARRAKVEAELVAAHEQRRAAIFARADAEEAKAAANNLIETLKTMVGRIKKFMSRPDLPAGVRADADRLSKEARLILSPEQSGEEPDRGPGL